MRRRIAALLVRAARWQVVGETPRSGIVHAVFPSRRGLLPSVRGLIDFLAAEYAALAADNKV